MYDMLTRGQSLPIFLCTYHDFPGLCRVKGFRFLRTLIFLPFIINMAAGFAFRILFEIP
jgi:ABC-type sugar transport system permease subunit